MKTSIASLAAAGSRPTARAILGISLCALSAVALTGCKTLDEPGRHTAGFTLIDPSQRNPIMVSEKPVTMNLRVSRNAQGLTPAQRSDVIAFVQRFRASDAGNSKLVIGVPAGSPNDVAAMRVVSEMRYIINEVGFADNVIVVQPYQGGPDTSAPIRFSYMRYVAEGPECGLWPTNLAREPRNLNYPNFGCAQQNNLAAVVANPADLVVPRTMDPADGERRAIVFDKYRQGQPTLSERTADERATVKGVN
jgi:pilus assembly protein CpaD